MKSVKIEPKLASILALALNDYIYFARKNLEDAQLSRDWGWYGKSSKQKERARVRVAFAKAELKALVQLRLNLRKASK